MTMRLLAKINKLSGWQIALILVLVGVAVFFSGLNNPFQGDDDTQIVNNVVVHSLSHIDVLFNGSTFYNGGGVTTPLSGTFYRPMMMVAFSIIYTLFGPNPVYFHLFQCAIVIANAFLVYLIFRRIMGYTLLSLSLSIIFLVHPINSQVAFAIPSLQDALFFFFGAVALWILIARDSTKSLWIAGTFLLLSLLSKETGIFFVLLCALYLFLFQRPRFVHFIRVASLPVILWLVVKIHAVGVLGTSLHTAPIDQLDLFGRLMNIPSIILFYLEKFVFPWHLASQYHWVYTTFSVQHVLLPLCIDIAALTLLIMTGRNIKRRASKAHYHTFLFFALWLAVGLSLYLQIIPLDMTVCENWFYFSLAGLLGVIGTSFMALKPRIHPKWLFGIVVIVVVALGVRTAIRGTDYSSAMTLSQRDIVASKEDFKAYTQLSQSYFNLAQYDQAESYAKKSIMIFPDVTNYQDLGAALLYQGDIDGAYAAYNNGLKYGSYSPLLDNLAELTLVHGSPTDSQQFFIRALNQYPNDPYLSMYYALLYYRSGNVSYAKAVAAYSLKNGESIALVNGVCNSIINNANITIVVGTKKVSIP